MSLPPDIGLVRSLIRSSFSELSQARIQPVKSAGTDNYLFRIDEDLCLRIAKTVKSAGSLIHREPAALKELADLPVEIPEFMARGLLPEPDPAPWVICTWLRGEDMESAGHAATAEDARRLALFLLDLQGSDRRLAKMPGNDNHWRGTALIERDALTRDAIAKIAHSFDAGQLNALWTRALEAPACEARDLTWIHGDLHPANLLVRDGALTSVIDWGLSGLGDPACDLMAAFTVFDGDSRDAFLQATGAAGPLGLRARGWALSTAAIALAHYQDGSDPIVARTRRVLNNILENAD